MGAGAYNRGSSAISDSIYGPDLSPDSPVVPRPADWGAKAYTKAAKRARSLVRHYKTKGRRYEASDIAEMIRAEQDCGKECAATAAKVATAECWGDLLDA